MPKVDVYHRGLSTDLRTIEHIQGLVIEMCEYRAVLYLDRLPR